MIGEEEDLEYLSDSAEQIAHSIDMTGQRDNLDLSFRAAIKRSRKLTHSKILIVEDDYLTLQLLAQLVSDEGYEVDTADNGSEALIMITREKYSLLLLNVNMPYMSGLELYEHIQRIDKTLANKVVFITGDKTTQVRAFLSRHKVPCIMKPFDVQQLMGGINRVLAQIALNSRY